MGIIPTYEQMLEQLKTMYNREDEIIKLVNKLRNEYNQIQEDKEMLETMIMYKYNKDVRCKKNVSNFKTNRRN